MANKKEELTLVREFDAPKEMVFKAFADAEALAEWWGPIEVKTSVVTLDFRPGGLFHYKMISPQGVNYGRFIYGKIQEPDLLEFIVSFSDEKAGIAKAPFAVDWPLEIFNRIVLTEKNGKTILTLTGYPVNATDSQYKVFTDMGQNIQNGFNGTFNQLERYINAQTKLRTQLKKDRMARTCTYLNFNGNTEEVFNFYRSVFGTEFNGNGIQRFGEIPQEAGHPPIAENIKKMVLHIELPILGGHVLMGTDAPEEMGFKLIFGNNSHISLEPESKQEADRLFNALSAGGTVSMPLQDMFFGAYFGEFKDKFGVNWMVNFSTK
jgi:uncharacterized glyoxalase superfamily protein PhnB/uncharacterized protein YndB with AHSA1/START domain